MSRKKGEKDKIFVFEPLRFHLLGKVSLPKVKSKFVKLEMKIKSHRKQNI